MFRFPARPDPTAFNSSNTLEAARNEIRRIFEAAVPGFASDEDRIEFPKTVLGRDSDHWKSFKGAFSTVQKGRCGYCEVVVVGTQPCDLEHFRPKGMIQILDPDNQGEEKDKLSNVIKRKALRTIGTGYWWDAYNWENYLLSCETCNRAWKRNFFPVDGDPLVRMRPNEFSKDVELLFHPFGDDEPFDHFRYELDGRIRGITKMGLATIETAGLWRPSLVVQRRKHIGLIARLISEMNGKEVSGEMIRSHARTIIHLGSDEENSFPGMVRIFWKQVSGFEWDELSDLAN